MIPPATPFPADLAATHDLLQKMLDVSLTGFILFEPLYGPDGELIDFAHLQLNPVAQRMLQLPARPRGTFLTLYPHAVEAGVFAFHREAYLSGEVRQAGFPYAYDGLDGYYMLAAQRSGNALLVSFDDTAARHQASRVEQALRTSHAREREARAEADAQRQRLHQALMQLPANIALLHGPEHVYDLVNPEYERLFPARSTLGRTIREVIPEIEGQGFFELLDHVYQTGEPFFAEEAETWADFDGSGQPQRRYYRTSFQPIRNIRGEVTEVLNFAVDVTAQVEARQQVEKLNQELEARVQERTRQLEEQQQLLSRILRQVPAAVGTLSGPEHRYTFANEHYHRMVGKREIVGLTVAEALPEVIEQGFLDLLERVRTTGEPFLGQEIPIQLYDEDTATLQQRYLNFVYQPLANMPGYDDDILVFAVDVTEQVRARQAAEDHAQRLRLITDALPVLIGYVDLEERYQFTNAAYRTWFGIDPQAMLGRPVREILSEAAYAGVKQYIDRARAGERVDFESFMPYRDDLKKYIRTSYVPDVQDGELRGFHALVTDITSETLARQHVEKVNQELEARVQERTEAAQAAQALAERERALLQALLAQAPVAIGLFQGEELRVTAVNEEMAALWGHTLEQVLGKPLLEGVPELQGQGFDEMLRQVLHTQEPISGTETPATMLRSGELKTTYYNFVYTPLYDAEGQVLGVIDVATEVTGQVEARRQIEQLNREAQLARAEAERQRSELERVFEQSPVAIAVFRGPNYIIDLANPTVARLWGRTREQLIGKGLFEALPEVAGMGFEELLDGVMATGEPVEAHAMEARHERNGRLETVYWDFVYVPMYEADGSVYGAMVVANEVTQQVLARREVEQLNQQLETRVLQRTQQLADALTDAEEQREQLRVQQGLLNSILGQVPASIATLGGPEHRHTFFNELYQELSAHRTALGRTVAEVFPEVVAQGFIELLDKVYATGEPFVGTDMPVRLYDARTGQPEQRYVDFIYQPLFDGQQRVTGILAFVLDVTDRVQSRHQAETLQAAMLAVAQRQALQNEQQQRRLQQLFEQAPIAIFVLRGTDYIMEVVNPVMSDMLGRPAADLLGRSFFEAVPELAGQDYSGLLAQVWRTEQPVVVAESPARLARHQADETGYFTFVYQPVFDGNDQMTDIMCVALDVSDQVRARRQVQELNDELQTTNKELFDANKRLTHTNADLDTFVYTASHDLKAPISNIEGLLDALREYLPASAAGTDPMVPRLLSMMQDSVARFQQTVAHLTDVSRLQYEQEAEAVDLLALVEDIRLDLTPLIDSTQARLLLEVEACPTVYFSVKNLRSILYNLLSNALKYHSPDRVPEVQLRASCTDEQVVLMVQDNGLGLNEQQQQRLFTLFRRLHTHVEGSGVGLYMLKRIVENAGGSIGVHSEPNVGSTFTVTLPRARPSR